MTTLTALSEDLRLAAEKNAAQDWQKEIRLQALEKSGYPALPSRDNESWRKIDLAGLDLGSFNLTGSRTSLEVIHVPDGVVALEGDVALDKKPGSAEIQRDFALARLEDEKANVFSLLTLALTQKSLFIQADRPVAEPLVIRHGLEDGDALLHNTSVHVAPGAELTVVEDFRGRSAEDFRLWSSLTDVRVEDGARLNYIALMNYTDCEYHFQNFSADLGRDARVHVSVAAIGGHTGKSFYAARLREPGGEFRGIGVGAGSGREFNDMEMLVEHHADHTVSSLLYKTVLDGRAHSVFNGNLYIAEHVRRADSHQINNNVLLSKKARAESMPNLIIKSEDVSCEHGATVGELGEEALFFLMARGIPEKEARELMIEGYIRSLVQEIPLGEEKRDEILTAVKNKISL